MDKGSLQSLIMEPGQLVTGHHHMLHPRFRDHHQVSHAPADVVSAHGQSESCGHGNKEMKQEEGRTEDTQEQEQANKGQVQRVFVQLLCAEQKTHNIVAPQNMYFLFI